MPTCKTCKQDKPLNNDEFRIYPNGHHSGDCRQCLRNKNKLRYANLTPDQKAIHKQQGDDWRKNNRAKWNKLSRSSNKKSRQKPKSQAREMYKNILQRVGKVKKYKNIELMLWFFFLWNR